MDKSGAKFKFVGHSTEIIRQSKNKGTLKRGDWFLKTRHSIKHGGISQTFQQTSTGLPNGSNNVVNDLQNELYTQAFDSDLVAPAKKSL